MELQIKMTGQDFAADGAILALMALCECFKVPDADKVVAILPDRAKARQRATAPATPITLVSKNENVSSATAKKTAVQTPPAAQTPSAGLVAQEEPQAESTAPQQSLYTIEELRKSFGEFAKSQGREKAKGIRQDMGYSKITEIPPERYTEAMGRIGGAK